MNPTENIQLPLKIQTVATAAMLNPVRRRFVRVDITPGDAAVALPVSTSPVGFDTILAAVVVGTVATYGTNKRTNISRRRFQGNVEGNSPMLLIHGTSNFISQFCRDYIVTMPSSYRLTFLRKYCGLHPHASSPGHNPCSPHHSKRTSIYITRKVKHCHEPTEHHV